MADPYGTEEEQIRALKDWWDRNGSSTLIGVGLAIALVGGWNWWKAHREEQVSAAAMLYQQLEQAAALGQDEAAQRATAEHLAEQLHSDFKGSRYSHYGQFLLARQMVETGKLDDAESILRGLINEVSEDEIKQLATLRLARVQFAKGDGELALKTLSGSLPGAFESQYAALRGDIHVSLDQPDPAIEAYRHALEVAQSQGFPASGLLQIKLDALTSAANRATENETGEEQAAQQEEPDS